MKVKGFRVLFVLILLAGCSTTLTETEYYIEATAVSTPPEDATVIDKQDSQIEDLDSVQKVLNAPENKTRLEITESEYQQINGRFEQLPLYNYTANDHSYDVLYVDTGNSTKRLRVFRNVLV